MKRSWHVSNGEESGTKPGVKKERKLFVVLENAQLEVGKVGQNFELLASDKHRGFLKKNKKDPANYRPDITHQCLLMLLDSPLNRSQMLRIFIHTANNVLIQVNPQTRIPRTYDRFAGLMVQLLQKLQVRSTEGSQQLLKVIKNPVEKYLPTGCRRICTSFHTGEVVRAKDLVPADEPITIVVGAMATGSLNISYTDEDAKISSFPLSAALACVKITDAFEEVWGVL